MAQSARSGIDIMDDTLQYSLEMSSAPTEAMSQEPCNLFKDTQ